jgi:hypothetical protein
VGCCHCVSDGGLASVMAATSRIELEFGVLGVGFITGGGWRCSKATVVPPRSRAALKGEEPSREWRRRKSPMKKEVDTEKRRRRKSPVEDDAYAGITRSP